MIVKEGEVSDFGAAMTVLSNVHSGDAADPFCKHGRHHFGSSGYGDIPAVIHGESFVDIQKEIFIWMPCVVTCP